MYTKRFFLIGLMAVMIAHTGANAVRPSVTVRPMPVVSHVPVMSYVVQTIKKHPYMCICAAGLGTVNGILVYRWYKHRWPFRNQERTQNSELQTMRQRINNRFAQLLQGGRSLTSHLPAVRPLFGKAMSGVSVAYNKSVECVGKAKPAVQWVVPSVQAAKDRTVSAVKGVYRYFRPAQQPLPVAQPEPAPQPAQAEQQPAAQPQQPAAQPFPVATVVDPQAMQTTNVDQSYKAPETQPQPAAVAAPAPQVAPQEAAPQAPAEPLTQEQVRAARIAKMAASVPAEATTTAK